MGKAVAPAPLVGALAGLALIACGGGDPPAVDGAVVMTDAALDTMTAAETGGADLEAEAGEDDATVEGDAAAPGHVLSAAQCTPTALADLFVDRVPPSAFQLINLTPAAGMAGLRATLQGLVGGTRPVRVRLQPGTYAAAGPGASIDVVGLARAAAVPVVVEAVDPAPNATRLAQGLRFVGASHLVIDGVTIGPPAVGTYRGGDFCQPSTCYHEAPKPLGAAAGLAVLGTAITPERAGVTDAAVDFAVYGRYAPAHDVVIRRVTIQNLFADDEPSGRAAAAGSSDGIVVAHARDVVVASSRVRQVSGHGLELIGVHGACVSGNYVAEIGRGLGASARAGSVDVTFDGNLFADVPRVELGGIDSAPVAHWSAEPRGTALHYAYEGRRIVARNNVVVDGRQGGFAFAACVECAAIGNTVVLRAAFDRSEGGGDVVRELTSQLNPEGAGAACLGPGGALVASCWQAGPYPPGLVPPPTDQARILASREASFGNNLFANADGLWGPELNPYHRVHPGEATAVVLADHNYWWNGPNALLDPGDGSFLPEGTGSIFAGGGANAALGVDLALAVAWPAVGAPDELRAKLTPRVDAPFVGKANATLAGYAAHDGSGRPRPATPGMGAFEPR